MYTHIHTCIHRAAHRDAQDQGHQPAALHAAGPGRGGPHVRHGLRGAGGWVWKCMCIMYMCVCKSVCVVYPIHVRQYMPELSIYHPTNQPSHPIPLPTQTDPVRDWPDPTGPPDAPLLGHLQEARGAARAGMCDGGINFYDGFIVVLSFFWCTLFCL